MDRILIETQYLPSLEFFCAIAKFDEVRIEWFENYVKQSYRNHTLINTANGILKLTVPLSAKGNRTIVKDIKTDTTRTWRNNQWRTIESAYRKSPFYEHYADDLSKIIFSKNFYLVELNRELLFMCFNWLHWQKKMTVTENYQDVPVGCLDLRNVLLSKKTYTERNFYKPIMYTQVFGNTFVENLSLIDLIFCKGPEAGDIILSSSVDFMNL